MGCSFTANTLQTVCMYVPTLYIHCTYIVATWSFRNAKNENDVKISQVHLTDLTASGSVHCKYTADWSLVAAFLYSAHTLPLAGGVFAAYTAATLKLYCLYTPHRSGFALILQVLY